MTLRRTFAAWRRAAAAPFNWRGSLRIGGRRYAVPVLGGIRARRSEPWMTDLLAQLMAEPPGAFVDVGANRGQTMLKVCAIDPDRQYLGIEPNPVCVGYLHRLIALNGLDNRTILPVGIAGDAGLAWLDLYGDDADSTASIVPGFRAVGRVRARRAVPVLNEATLGALPDRIAVLKIDVEGGELGVIEGLIATIRRTRPHIVLEILPPRGRDDRLDRQRRVWDMLTGAGYRASRIVKAGGRLGGLERVDALADHSDMALVDYLFSADLADAARKSA